MEKLLQILSILEAEGHHDRLPDELERNFGHASRCIPETLVWEYPVWICELVATRKFGGRGGQSTPQFSAKNSLGRSAQGM
jgi:hypothetical protein